MTKEVKILISLARSLKGLQKGVLVGRLLTQLRRVKILAQDSGQGIEEGPSFRR